MGIFQPATVDGRNPARKPVDVVILAQYFARLHTSQMVQDFFHQLYQVTDLLFHPE